MYYIEHIKIPNLSQKKKKKTFINSFRLLKLVSLQFLNKNTDISRNPYIKKTTTYIFYYKNKT